MNKGSNNHYTLLVQDEAETDGVCIEEEEEELEDGLNVMEEEDEEEEEEEEEEEDEPMEDSDEEEIFSSSKHRTLTHHEEANLNGQNHIGGHGNEYRLLNNKDGDLKTVLDTPITIWTPTPMSPARRACFIASIMLGILVVATFLWVLPCDVQPCEGQLGLIDRDWAVKIEGMGISQTKLVQRLDGGYNVLLSYYSSVNISAWDSDNSTFPDDESWQTDHSQTECSNCGLRGSSGSDSDGHCGLLMLDGNLGRENWRMPLRECPLDLQCDLLDVSGDNLPDCIVRGTNSMVFMIEARYGNPVWHLHAHKEIEVISSPGQPTMKTTNSPLRLYNPGPALLLPDVNNDSFGELLFSGLLSYENIHSWNQEHPDSETWNTESESPESVSSHTFVNQLVLVCGQSGNVIGSPFVLKQCQKILSVTSDGQAISYSCLGIDGDKKAGKMHLTALLHQILGSSAPMQESESSQNTEPQTLHYPIHYEQREPCQVILFNQDVCPHCQSKIHFTHSDGRVLWHKDYKHSTVVSWAALLSDGECHGAILKLWEWKHVTTLVKTARPPPLVNKKTTRSSFISDAAETEPTFLEKNTKNEIEFDIAFNSNLTSESNKIPDLPLDSFLKKYSKHEHSVVNEEIINPVREDYSDVQPSTTSESPRVKKTLVHNSQLTYEHPTIHHHHGKQASGDYEDHTQHSESLTTEEKQLSQRPEKIDSETHDFHRTTEHFPEQLLTTPTLPGPIQQDTRTMSPSILAPPGYQLQQIHERLILLKNNGTVWLEEPLANLALGISQLCKNINTCIPDTESHARSVAVTPGVEERAWQLISSSTTYVHTPIYGEQHHTSPWTLTSIVRKIIVKV